MREHIGKCVSEDCDAYVDRRTRALFVVSADGVVVTVYKVPPREELADRWVQDIEGSFYRRGKRRRSYAARRRQRMLQ
jgi:hypothetical protein